MATPATPQEHPEQGIITRPGPLVWLAGTAAWIWAIVAGGGGFLLLLSRGPLPLTNGWFAMFSGIAACRLTAILAQNLFGIRLSGRTRLIAAASFFVAGRIALLIGSRVPWLSR